MMPLVSKTLGQASLKGLQRAVVKPDLVITATLLRGKIYYYKDEPFEYNTPKVVSKELADILEEEVYEVKLEGTLYERATFHIKRNVPRPPPVETKKPLKRLPRLDG